MPKHVIAIGLTSVRPSVTRWYSIKTAEHIVMLSSPHDSPFILVLCVTRYSRNSDGVTPCGGAKQRWGMIKPAIFQKHSASINRSIQRAINLVRRSTAINTLANSVVRYPQYLDTYRRYLRDDTSIAKVTIYRGIS